MREVRLGVRYSLSPDKMFTVRTAWLVDTPAARSQIDEMIANARQFDAAATYWIEERHSSENEANS